MDNRPPRHRIGSTAVILIAMALSGCLRLDCEPQGKVLWGGSGIPTGMPGLIHAVDGGMAGLSCDYEVTK